MNAPARIVSKRTVNDFKINDVVRVNRSHELYWRYAIGKVVRITERFVHVELNGSEGRVHGFLPENITTLSTWGFA